jgi:L-amino acid N-acyltransferase YncA
MGDRITATQSVGVGPTWGMHLRLATADDAAPVRSIYGPIIESTVISFEVVVPTVDEMAARIADRQPRYPWLVAEDGPGVIGYAYGGAFAPRSAYGWSVEVTAYVAEAAWGQGVGRALYAALLAILAAQGYRQAMAGITLPNAASVGLHEAVGFAAVGVYRAAGWKFGAWRDVGWWQRELGPDDEAPHEPILLDALPAGVLDDAFAAAVGSPSD